MIRPAPVLLAALLALPACADSGPARRTPLSGGAPTTDRAVKAGRAFTLAPGDTASLSGVRVTFVGVSSDSRCPSDVTCAWPGDAAIDLGTSDGPITLHTLQTPSNPPIPIGPYHLVLLDLLPKPHSDTPLPPTSYRLHLRLDP
ncbi:hypothetical protein [Actinocorallia sp. A-T 12471]|uniref:hypothetical protein n=1 Tax=Actinocorallia sp. A-T 12471 TaxID=3089813 RepID=UPI0029CCCFE9|nr:hypothetical protein [Actinocorallia sp. A-T 12471]MDX6740035.1 hypothetical protein [Actinocorallia sp. A-T 12471]